MMDQIQDNASNDWKCIMKLTIKPGYIFAEIIIYGIAICVVKFVFHQHKIALALNVFAIIDIMLTYMKYISQGKINQQTENP